MTLRNYGSPLYTTAVRKRQNSSVLATRRRNTWDQCATGDFRGGGIQLADRISSESSDEVEVARIVNAPSRIELYLLHTVSEKEIILQSKVAERGERLRVLADSFEEEANRLVIGIQMVELFEHLCDSLNRDFVDCAPVALQNGLNASCIPRANRNVNEGSLRIRKVDGLSLRSSDLLHAESVRILAVQ